MSTVLAKLVFQPGIASEAAAETIVVASGLSLIRSRDAQDSVYVRVCCRGENGAAPVRSSKRLENGQAAGLEADDRWVTDKAVKKSAGQSVFSRRKRLARELGRCRWMRKAESCQ